MVAPTESDIQLLAQETEGDDTFEPIRSRRDGRMPTSSQRSKLRGKYRNPSSGRPPRRHANSNGMHRRFVKKIR